MSPEQRQKHTYYLTAIAMADFSQPVGKKDLAENTNRGRILIARGKNSVTTCPWKGKNLKRDTIKVRLKEGSHLDSQR